MTINETERTIEEELTILNKQLNPCPYCNSKVEIIPEFDECYGMTYAIECPECDIYFSFVDIDCRKPINVADAWNGMVADANNTRESD